MVRLAEQSVPKASANYFPSVAAAIEHERSGTQPAAAPAPRPSLSARGYTLTVNETRDLR